MKKIIIEPKQAALTMTTQSLNTAIQSEPLLYDQDYFIWLESTVVLLRRRMLREVDTANLIEEIDDRGKNQK